MWQKKGRLFHTDNNFDWMVSHASVPVAHPMPDGRIRLFFAARNKMGQSLPTFIDLDTSGELKPVSLHERPILSLGKLGCFDDGGMMPCSIVAHDGALYMYYVGWNASVSVPYRNAIGLAVSTDGGLNFERMFEGPIVDRNRDEPYFTASPCVMKMGSNWHMWYASTTSFVVVNHKPEPVYLIKYARSINGIDWLRENITCIHPRSEFEANARPTVIHEEGKFKMWYCYRGSFDYRDGKDSYRIGYAESSDGKSWIRRDEDAGIDVSEKGWDSKMITYPYVISFRGEKYMFYNGNGFGKEGLGYAIWK